MTIADRPGTAEEWQNLVETVREPLRKEWEERAPSSADEVLAFYRETEQMDADLHAFHMFPERQAWTAALLHVAANLKAELTIDIGCGAGHDLRALRDAGHGGLYGVEPNERFRRELAFDQFRVLPDVADAPIEDADLLSCFDVLEHVVDPESWLGSIAQRAKVGCVLVETCATFDCDTPLHLEANRGWRTGRVLERNGWEKIGEEGRLRVWQRRATENRLSTTLILCAFRTVSLPTHRAILSLLQADPTNVRGWREGQAAEAGLLRARNIAASRWYTDTADDVFLMVDDDIVFEPKDAEHLVDLCRDGHDIIAAAYPVRDGGQLAVRALDGESTSLDFGPNLPPRRMRHMATGFFAVHRRVMDALIPTLPLCHANQPWAFWPMFDFRVVSDAGAGGNNHLSEDYNFCELAIERGISVWLDPTIKLRHLGLVPISVRNMGAISEAIKHA